MPARWNQRTHSSNGCAATKRETFGPRKEEVRAHAGDTTVPRTGITNLVCTHHPARAGSASGTWNSSIAIEPPGAEHPRELPHGRRRDLPRIARGR